MAFWSSERIREEQKKLLLIDGKYHNLIEEKHYEPRRVKHGKYALTLSRQVIVTPNGTTSLPACGEGPTLTILPGQYAILYAQEKIAIPNYAIALISVSFANTYQGLVNISGFHVDPGFTGQLKFSVYNAGNNPIYLDYGSECFQIWFADLEPATGDTYKGEHKDQDRVTPEDRAQMSDRRHSPAALNDRIENLERNVKTIYAVGVVIVVPLLIGLAVALFDHWIGEKNNLDIKGELFTVGALIIIIALLTGFAGAIAFSLLKPLVRWLNRRFRQ